ncbi:TPA: non-ribosomal peptide synthetase [Legionella pneumophila]|nr:non-ribosomal peptide synthetase [Legionella pneumophila]
MMKNSNQPTILQGFQYYANQFPDKIAVISQDKTYSYKDLYKEANNKSFYLKDIIRKLSNKPKVIPILAERNIDTITWMLACIQVQVPFLNLDYKRPWPINFNMINSLNAEKYILAVNPSLITDFVEEKSKIINSSSVESVNFPIHTESLVRLDNPIYMISTSGTTGTPKISMIPYRSFLNCSAFFEAQFKLSIANYNTICIMNPHFDVFITETIVPLEYGATIQLISDDDKYDPMRLAAIINKVTPHWLNTTYTLYNEMCGYLHNSVINHLIFLGEKIGELKQNTFKIARHVWNVYGPSEASLCVSIEHIVGGRSISIGNPIPSNFAWVLDFNKDSQVAVGTLGEITLAGINLSLGYYDASQNSPFKIRNLPNYKGALTPIFSYRTGDIGYQGNDGKFYVTGRIGRKIKVRAQWVDLDSLEKIILDNINVNQAKVYYQKLLEDNAILVAYIQVSSDNFSSQELIKLKQRLSKKLLPHEIPAYFIPVQRFPRNRNDKVSEEKLVEMAKKYLQIIAYDSQEDYSPSDQQNTSASLENINLLKALWKEILKHEKFSIYDSFFDVGGNSLLLYHMMLKLHQTGYQSITARDLFMNLSIEKIAACLDEMQKNQ